MNQPPTPAAPRIANNAKAQFLGAAGSSGFEAATNIVVKKANREMLFYVYGAVLALCLLTFRSVKTVLCIIVPLALTSVLGQALMTYLGIGVKVATLPVIALGVGIGFGLQAIVSNFVSGLILLFERPIRVGDVVTVEGTTGTVTQILMRATTITNWDRQEFVVPNKTLITSPLLNLTLSSPLNRIELPVGVAYSSDIDKVIETLKEIKKSNPYIQVIIITGHGTVETAVKATKLGAFDLIQKPLSIDKVIVTINNALNFRRLEEENRYLRKKTIEKNSITGNSPVTIDLKKDISIAAPKDAWILITGENGTGKELIARTIHQLSSRALKPLIDVNCAAIPENLLEGILFGTSKGAFTGAHKRKKGRFELADGGTLFLDEIGEMPLHLQTKILRAIQEKEIMPVGAEATKKVDIRIIAATNLDLKERVPRGEFREDLYYRLSVVPLRLPPLRKRKEDIPLLINHFIKKHSNSSTFDLQPFSKKD